MEKTTHLQSNSVYMVVYLNDYHFDNPPHIECRFVDGITKYDSRQASRIIIIRAKFNSPS